MLVERVGHEVPRRHPLLCTLDGGRGSGGSDGCTPTIRCRARWQQRYRLRLDAGALQLLLLPDEDGVELAVGCRGGLGGRCGGVGRLAGLLRGNQGLLGVPPPEIGDNGDRDEDQEEEAQEEDDDE